MRFIDKNDGWFRQVLALGCPQAEGYIFSRPLPAVELETLVARLVDGALRPASH